MNNEDSPPQEKSANTLKATESPRLPGIKYYLLQYAAIGFGAALVTVIGAQVVAVAQGRLSTVGAFVMCGLWQLVLAAGFAICGAAAAATVPTAPAKQASPTFSFAEMEDAYNALNRTIIASEVFDDDDAYSSKLMNDDDRRNARDALETLGKIVNRWKSDLRLYKHMKVSRPVQIKKKS